MFFKRILAILMALVLMISLTACGQSATIESATSQKEKKVEVNPSTEPVEKQDTENNYVENIPEVPLYNQLDYYQTRYGDSTISRSGCGITCYAMVLSYLLDREIFPDELAAMYHQYKVEGGSAHTLFTDTQDEWGVVVQDCYWEEAWGEGKVMEALQNGQPIIANVHADSAFTDDGHFIVLYGLTDDGKIMVRDPNGGNYTEKAFLIECFANGFEPEYFKGITANYFIYEAKNVDVIAN